jgi:hypothetical protein
MSRRPISNGREPEFVLAEFSTIAVGVFVYAIQLHSLQKQPNLKVKTRPEQLLGYLPLVLVLLTYIVC